MIETINYYGNDGIPHTNYCMHLIHLPPISIPPDMSYRIDASDTLSGFQEVPGSIFTADGYSRTMTRILHDIRGFVRANKLD